MAKKKVKAKSVKSQILADYASLVKKLPHPPQMKDLIDAGHTKDKIVYYFQSLSRLDAAARAKYPDSFCDVSVESLVGPKKIKKLEGALDNSRRFVITTAVMGCKADVNFYKSIKNYCKKQKAELLILVVEDPARRQDKKNLGFVDRILRKEHFIISDVALNSNLFISQIKLSAKHIDPITGLARIGQRNGSFIYASPKQRYKAVPVANKGLPHVLMTTGAITKPDYNTDTYMSLRTAYIATNDHVMGALVVEKQDNKIFHVRQIQADKKGHFIDLGKKYGPDSVVEERPEALVLGDYHAGETSPSAKAAWFDVASVLQPKRIVLHDLFNGLSISHHEKNMHILKAQRAEAGQLDLRSELKIVTDELNELTALCESVVVVRSNHDDFLDRYLEEARYIHDPQNKRIALELALAKLDNHNPLQVAVESLGLLHRSKVRWLDRDADFKIARIQLGEHGDKGANGAKGSLQAMEHAYGQSVTGHSHTPEILRGAWSVGTSSELKLSYTQGASSWAHASILIYANGSRQLILSIDGAWRLKE